MTVHETPRMSAETEQNSASANPQKLLALAERCEKAVGPDREIDGAIDRLLNERPADHDYSAIHDCIWAVDDHSGLCVASNGFARDSFRAREFTASLDAAMTLVPEGMGWFKERGAYVSNIAVIQGPTCSFVGETDSSFTLALCAAALRARATIPSPVKEAE